jgi:hypothetical protein
MENSLVIGFPLPIVHSVMGDLKLKRSETQGEENSRPRLVPAQCLI